MDLELLKKEDFLSFNILIKKNDNIYIYEVFRVKTQW